MQGPRSVFPVAPRRNVNERRHCFGCDKPLTPLTVSSDANFCRPCLTKLESAFSTRPMIQFIEKPVVQVETETITEYKPLPVVVDSHPDRTRALTESRLTTVQHCILLNERCEGLKIQLEGRDVEIERLQGEVRHLKKQLKRHGKQSS